MGLPNQLIVAFSKGFFTTLVTESVRRSEPTGKLTILGWLDYNRDGFSDLIIDGRRGDCVYRLLFEGFSDGFTKAPMPQNACGCP